MTSKIVRSIFGASIAVWFTSLLLIFGILYDYYGMIQNNQLDTTLNLSASGVEHSGADFFDTLDEQNIRITWINDDGTVLYDTQQNVDVMENHSDRDEIKQAFEEGYGESARYSSTLMEKTMYKAKLLSDGTVIRAAVSHASLLLLMLGMLQPICIVFAFALILSIVLAYRLSRRIIEPLEKLDLEHPLENYEYEELTPLVTKIEQQHIQINRQMTELKNRKDEFYAVVRNMNEGLILLNCDGIILSINPSAKRFLAVNDDCDGIDFLTLERNIDILNMLNDARTEGHGEITVSRNGRIYKLNASSISTDEAAGMVILIFDITENELAERNRREFTANVSHELKTPLQSIMGSAELIENNLVKNEDLPRFVGHIRKESERLVALIEDIIRLSQLDEQVEMNKEEVDMTSVIEEIMESLTDAAEAKNISVNVHGEGVKVFGVRRLLSEIMFNLIDNAIKYNVENGSINIYTKETESDIIIEVQDEGIGIPAEHQDRIFERFYRVDKSHSKDSGGTGLGLSIVKHALMYHHGAVYVDSAPGKGTTMRIILPKMNV